MKTTATLPDTIDIPTGSSGVFAIWPDDGVPPEAKDWTHHEQSMQIPWAETSDKMVRNVVIPTLTQFDPAPGTANGTALIIAPGGGFHFLMIDHEGNDMARRLAQRGITCFVLRYRLARTPDNDAELEDFRNDLHRRFAEEKKRTPPQKSLTDDPRMWGEADGRQAISFLRENATELGINSNRIGISGFSAGGAVAIGATIEHDEAANPNFLIAIYPGYRLQKPVPADAPPLFAIVADDDSQVPPMATTNLYNAWHEAGKSAEVHVFANGEHGFGMRQQDKLTDAWFGLLENWLQARGLFDK